MPKYGVDGWMLQTTSTTIWFVESIAFHEYFEYQTLPLLCLIFVFALQVGGKSVVQEQNQAFDNRRP